MATMMRRVPPVTMNASALIVVVGIVLFSGCELFHDPALPPFSDRVVAFDASLRIRMNHPDLWNVPFAAPDANGDFVVGNTLFSGSEFSVINPGLPPPPVPPDYLNFLPQATVVPLPTQDRYRRVFYTERGIVVVGYDGDREVYSLIEPDGAVSRG